MADERRSAERNAVMLGAEPELVLHYRDPATSASGYAVIDTLTHNVAFGGVRVKRDLRWIDLALLARIGTIRYQLARVGIGGARLGIDYDPQAEDLDEVLARFLTAIRSMLERSLSIGPDFNMPGPRLEKIISQHELPWRMQAVQRQQGWPTERWAHYQKVLDELDEAGYSLRDRQVAYSVAVAAMAMGDFLFHRQLTVAVIGSGSFGFQIARLLHRFGASVLAIGGSSAGIYAPGGLKPNLLDSGIDVGMSLDPSHMFITHDEFYSLPVDVLVLASTGDAITVDNVGKLRASLVVEAAARSVSHNAEKVLVARGTPVLPSFAVTMGAVVIADSVLHGEVNDSHAAIARLSEQVNTTVQELARLAGTLRISLREAGVRLAYHRWNISPPEMIAGGGTLSLSVAEEPPEMM